MKPNAPATSLDVAKASAGLSSESEVESTPTPESKRRRLVGGAVALVPLVLTLRSGGVAAASCTGAKALSVRTNQNGRFNPPFGAGVAAGDYCVDSESICADQPSKIMTQGANVDLAPITGPYPNGKFQCGVTGRRTVAIVSSASASSLIAG